MDALGQEMPVGKLCLLLTYLFLGSYCAFVLEPEDVYALSGKTSACFPCINNETISVANWKIDGIVYDRNELKSNYHVTPNGLEVAPVGISDNNTSFQCIFYNSTNSSIKSHVGTLRVVSKLAKSLVNLTTNDGFDLCFEVISTFEFPIDYINVTITFANSPQMLDSQVDDTFPDCIDLRNQSSSCERFNATVAFELNSRTTLPKLVYQFILNTETGIKYCPHDYHSCCEGPTSTSPPTTKRLSWWAILLITLAILIAITVIAIIIIIVWKFKQYCCCNQKSDNNITI